MPTAKRINSMGIDIGENWTGSVKIEDDVTADNFLGCYKTIWIPANQMYITSTSPAAAIATAEEGSNDVEYQYFAFDGGATEERVMFAMVMPANWDLGTINAKFYWSSDSSSTAADTVQWAIQGRSYADSDDKDAAFGTAQVISDILLASEGADLQITSATPDITIGNSPAADELIMFNVYRDTSGTDDMEEDAWLFGVLIQYRENAAETAW